MNSGINEIRQLISESKMEEAFGKTRQLLLGAQDEESLLQLDLIQSEWNDVRAKTLNGLLSVDDELRLDNISKAKLLELLLQKDGKANVAENLRVHDEPGGHTVGKVESGNLAFKNGFKNAIGVLFFMSSAGALIGQSWLEFALFGLCGLIIFVPSLKFIEKTLGYQFFSWQKYVIVIGALLTLGSMLPKNAPTAPNKSHQNPRPGAE